MPSRPVPRTPPSVLLALVVALLALPTGSADAAGGGQGGPVGTTTSLRAGTAYAGRPAGLVVRLRDAEGAPVGGVDVTIERRRERGTWRALAVVTTDDRGRAASEVVLDRLPAGNVVRASWSGDETRAPSGSGRVAVALERRSGVARLAGPSTVVDEQSVTLRLRFRARNGESGPSRVVVQRRVGRDPWRRARRLTTGDDGRASFSVAPRQNTRWRVRGLGQAWVTGARSAAHRLVNTPPGDPVSLPAAAPRPRVRVPVQQHGQGDGANPSVSAIPDGVWGQMTGRTWHEGCPVGRSSLRLLRVNYWDYTGYRRRGEMVLNADVAGQVSAALVDMYAARLPLRSMYREDRFGWNKRLNGADDYTSMAAGNTSAFNCRSVVNMPSRLSPHSYGRAIDLNTWENPYRSATGLVPNSWWQPHSHPRVAWRSSQHQVVAILARHGIRWTYGLDDTQHFDARPPGSGRIRVPDCGDVVCE